MIEIAAMILMGVLFIGSLAFAVYNQKRQEKNFLEFGRELNLERQEDPEIWQSVDFQGEIDGREVQVLRRMPLGKGPRPTDFGVRVQVPMDFEFSLLSDPAADMKRIPLVGGVLGQTLEGVKALDQVEDMLTGFPDFDRDWLVTSNRLELLRAILTDPVREKLNELRDVGPQTLMDRLQGEVLPTRMPVNLQLQEGVLCLYIEDTCHKITYLRKSIQHLLFIAREIDRACDGWM